MFKLKDFVNFVKSLVGMPYWFGSSVDKCTDELCEKLSAMYPTQYSASKKKKMQEAITKKKVCTDASGLIKGFFWTNGGTGVLDYINGVGDFEVNHDNGYIQDIGADAIFSFCKSEGAECGDIATMPDVAGVLVFSSGHVGVYIGDGCVIEARGFSYGVVCTKLDERPWKKWAYLPSSILQYADLETENESFNVVVIRPCVNVREEPNIGKVKYTVHENDILEIRYIDKKTGWYCLKDGSFIRNDLVKRI